MKSEGVLELMRVYRDEWLVLDRTWSVLDRGSDLGALRARWAGRRATFLRSPR
ncbi:MAG: hypothetical protein KGL53_16245 [Elusimicrobia bacterium]|nr:hypothetical protein [Elusimicrobiota bacterium]